MKRKMLNFFAVGLSWWIVVVMAYVFMHAALRGSIDAAARLNAFGEYYVELAMVLGVAVLATVNLVVVTMGILRGR